MSALSLLLLVGCVLLNSKAEGQLFAPASPPSGFNNIRVPGGYLPPRPENPMCLPETHYETVLSTSQVLVTFTADVPGRTTQIVQTQYVPTTVVTTQISTVYSTVTDGQTQTQTQDRYSTYVTTFGGIPVTRTQYTTLTSVERDTRTEYDAIQSVVYVTMTRFDSDETTLVVPTTLYRTAFSTLYSTLPFYQRDVTLTETETRTIYSTFETQLAARTIYNTRTVFSTSVRTNYVTVPAQTRVDYITSNVENLVTRTTTLTRYVTNTRQTTSFVEDIVVNTNIRFDTLTSTYAVTQTSQVVHYNTQDETKVQFSTIYDSQVISTTIQQPDIIRTQTEQAVQTVTGRGSLAAVTRTNYATEFDQRTTTVSQAGIQRTITATRTIQEECGATGYNYEPPSIPFNF